MHKSISIDDMFLCDKLNIWRAERKMMNLANNRNSKCLS